jgi:uncharacterized protein YjlB
MAKLIISETVESKGLKKSLGDIAKKHGFNFSHEDEMTTIHHYHHSSGNVLKIGSKGWLLVTSRNEPLNKGFDNESLDQHLGANNG